MSDRKTEEGNPKKTAGFRGSPKLTPELTEEICRRVRRCCWRETACASVGISSRTLRIWLRQAVQDFDQGLDTRFTRLSAALDEAESHAEVQLTMAVMRGAMKDPRSALQLMAVRYRDRWAINARASAEDVRNAIDSELERLLDIAAEALGQEASRKLLAAIVGKRGREETESPSGEPIH